MSRTVYCTGAEMVAAGHQVDYIFAEKLKVPGPIQLRRFTVPILLPWLVRTLTRQGRHYDLVEIHEPIAAVYCLLRRFNRDWPPVVLFSYGLEERGRRVELAYRKQKKLPISLKKRLAPFSVVLQAAYAVRHCDHVVVSNSQDAAYLYQAGLEPKRVSVHHSGVEEAFLEAGLALGQAGHPRRGIIFLGTWLLRKGILDVVAALNTLLRQHSELNFTIAGSGCSREEVLTYFAPELHSRIEIIPKLANQQEVIATLSRHSIFVLPSYFEGQPLALIEAAALGLAIVTTNVCGMLDFIEDGVNGYLVPVGDEAALTMRLSQLVADEALARQLGEAARQTAQQFTWRQAAQALIEAYLRVLVEAQGQTKTYESTA